MNQLGPWQLYDELIQGIPGGIAVGDYCVGAHWTYVEADSGVGISKSVRGGSHGSFHEDPCSLDLKTLAALAKSWNWLEASLGVAAINAWYSTAERVQAMGGSVALEHAGRAGNPFSALQDAYAGKKVTVIGHFPNVDRMQGTCDLTVLERDCTSALDTPDSACEFVLPEQDFVFMTGTTLTNKTIVRLLELCRAKDGPKVALIGPSTPAAEVMIAAGATYLAGSVVVDAASAKAAVKGGTKQQWRAGIKKFLIQAK